jgi:hypothetical protein
MKSLVPEHFLLNAEAARVHEANHKWWHDLHTGERLIRNPDELLMLMVSEAAEAMEGERKNLMDDKIPTRKMAEVEIADILIRALDFSGGLGYEIDEQITPVPLTENRAQSLLRIVKVFCRLSDSIEIFPNDVETAKLFLSRAVVSCFAYAEKFGYDLLGAYEEKMAVNRVRPDHQKEARLGENGKKF